MEMRQQIRTAEGGEIGDRLANESNHLDPVCVVSARLAVQTVQAEAGLALFAWCV
jgi:hypothetical protein